MSLLTDVQTAATTFLAKVAVLVTQAGYLVAVVTGPASGPTSLVDVGTRTLKTLARVLYEIQLTHTFTAIGVYDPIVTYAAGDAVSLNAFSYVSIIDGNIGNDPSTSPVDWMQLVGLVRDNFAYYGIDYGIQGDDGTIDNATALAAIAAAVSATGGIVFLPPGKIKSTASVTFDVPAGQSLKLEGTGSGVTTLYFPAADGIIANYGDKYSGFHASGMTLTTGATSGYSAITINQPASDPNPALTGTTDFFDVVMRGDDGFSVVDAWSFNLKFNNVSNINVINCSAIGTGALAGVGIRMDGLLASSTYAVVLNVQQSNFYGLANGILYGDFVQGVTVNQCNFNSVSVGILVPSGSGGIHQQLNGSNNQFNCTVAIFAEAVISGLNLTDNHFIVEAGHQGVLANAVNFTIVGNSFLAGVADSNIAVQITGGGIGMISSNTFSGMANGIVLDSGVANVVVPTTNTYQGVTTELVDAGTSNTVATNTLSYGLAYMSADATGLKATQTFATIKGAVAVANGLNSNIVTPVNSFLRLTGPTAAFSIGGFTLGSDGYILKVYNATAETMTIVNEDASSTAANRIKTLTGGNVVLRANATSLAEFIYDTTESRWILTATN